MILAENIIKYYDKLQILKGINLSVKEGEIVSISGASGAGKTTLLQILGTLDKATSGSLKINHEEVSKLKDHQLSKFRNRHIGFIFQFHHLLPEFTAIENIAIPAFIGKVKKKVALHRASELMEEFHLGDRFHHKPSQLSGGEQQRVAVARALINNPSVIFADEPSGNLDSENALKLHKLFFDLREKYKQTFVIVTHNKEFANMADRSLTIKDGLII